MNISLFNILFFTFVIIIAGIFFITGIYYLIKTKKEKNYTCKVEGKVVNNIMHERLVSTNDSHRYTTKRYWYALCEYTVCFILGTLSLSFIYLIKKMS